MTICTRCLELEAKRQALDEALAAAESCHHVGEDSACLECQACERYMSGVMERRLREVEKERDQALACYQAAQSVLRDIFDGVHRLARMCPPGPMGTE